MEEKGRGGEEELRRVGGGGNCNQNILCGKKPQFSIKEKSGAMFYRKRAPGVHSLGSTDQAKGLSTLFASQPCHPVLMRPLA